MSLKKQNRTSTLQKALGKLGIKLSLIHAKGNAKSNRDYCTKADPQGFFELGNIATSGQGARTDLDSVVHTIRQGSTIEELVDKHPVEMIKFTRGINFVKSILDKKNIPKERDITVTVYYGPGGTGKTQHAHIDARRLGLELFILTPPSPGAPLYWGSYTNELGILLDDFYGWLKPHDLYRILDRYRYEANIKYGQVWGLWTHVWITSNSAPQNFYKPDVMATLDDEAYNRRFHNIYRLAYYSPAKDAVLMPEEIKKEKPLVFPLTTVQDEPVSVQNATPGAEEEEDS